MDEYQDPIDYYEDRFGITIDEERPRRPRRKRDIGHEAIIRELAEPTVLEAGLEEALRGFYDRDLLADVLSIVKGGREACVYRCVPAGPIKAPLVAAKVYRPRQFRNLRNDAAYREGRLPLTLSGKPLTERDQREMRAILGRTRFGESLRHTSWLMYEYTTLKTLFAAGGDVPEPYAVEANAILMSFIGDERTAAPTLHSVWLPRTEANDLFERLLHNVELMLGEGLIHGDLSPHNILLWQGIPYLIDFPQVTLLETSRRSETILARDIQRLCEYFERQGVTCGAAEITRDLWYRYGQDRAWAASDWDLSLLERD